MSYDFWLFEPIPDEDQLTTAIRLMEESEQELDARDPDPKAEVRKKALATAIIRQNPEIRPFSLQYDQIAEIQKITVEEARKKFRYIELNGPEDGNGIQVVLHDDSATIAVPYWHLGAQANAVFEEIWEYLRVIKDVAGYVAYDPQLDRILDLERDLKETLNAYLRIVREIKESPSVGFKSRKPWWKFW